MTNVSEFSGPQGDRQDDHAKAKFVALGGIVGAVAASSCCIVPLVLFSLGITGAWMGQLTALAPYQPIFIAVTVGFLGYGYWLVYHSSKPACTEDAACTRPLPNRIIRAALWFATGLVLLALAWPYLVRFILD